MKCPNCGAGGVKIVGPSMLGAAVVAGFLILGSGEKETTSTAVTATGSRPAPVNVTEAPASYAFSSGTSPQVPALKVLSAPNGLSWPTNAGYVQGYKSLDFGGSVVNIVNSKTANHFFVKLVNSARGIQSPSRHAYIGARQKFSIVNVAPGKYWIAFQDLNTGEYFKTTEFTLSEGPSSRDASQLQYVTAAFEFSKAKIGYLDASRVSASEFGNR
ncbi:MAG: hypothetical protein ACN6PV_11840 [Achromobacter sp.]|uniref:hypothetical protein n=1 Tax=Achromobacter sp. TaxID=134375 RepID=UPI003D07AEE0